MEKNELLSQIRDIIAHMDAEFDKSNDLDIDVYNEDRDDSVFVYSASIYGRTDTET